MLKINGKLSIIAGTECVLFATNDTFLCEERPCVQISHALSIQEYRNLRCSSRTKGTAAPASSSVTGDDRNRHMGARVQPMRR